MSSQKAAGEPGMPCSPLGPCIATLGLPFWDRLTGAFWLPQAPTRPTQAPTRPTQAQLWFPRAAPLVRRKLELQQAAAAALEQENSWWLDTADAPANLVTASTPAAFKALIVQAPANQLVVVDYLKPGCAGCRRLFPKLKQIAAQNPDALFLKVRLAA